MVKKKKKGVTYNLENTVMEKMNVPREQSLPFWKGHLFRLFPFINAPWGLLEVE